MDLPDGLWVFRPFQERLISSEPSNLQSNSAVIFQVPSVAIPFWARKEASDPPAGPAPTMKISVSMVVLIFALLFDAMFDSILKSTDWRIYTVGTARSHKAYYSQRFTCNTDNPFEQKSTNVA